ncbi:N-acetylglucosaminidase [Alkalicoccobacillus porphyridii]|uniref:SH3 domain-containing protein n=1 Tax=Alkalicoccobacillus porphyridii TaxID=2597270 RepID=A0A554A487_9BACI|nr:SH3 domain-containing protein [Alkalicoccobacillus porphyridii]TSB48485.1 SH3 domain-containing protein [Alkalicoccobacillus porphyridii]
MKKKVSIIVVLLLLFNLLSPYAAYAAEKVEIEEDTYELEDVNACLVDLLDREELGEEDLLDFHPDQLQLNEEEEVIFEDCLALLSLDEQEAVTEEGSEEPATEEGTEEAVTEEEAEEPATEEGTEEAVTEEEAEEPATEEGTEEAVTEEEAEEPATDEGTEETVTEEEAEESASEEGTEEAVTEDEEDSMIMFSMKAESTPVTKSTSRLGHLYSSTKVYRNLGDTNTLNASQLTHAVYYIKQEAQYNGSTYYLLSTSPSATNGVVGWALASQLTTYAHTVVDRQGKTFQVKGTSNAYTKAWGGNKDIVYNLANEKGKTFQVHLTEKVGNDIWYRGTLNNRTVWIHSSHVESVGKATSRLGHLYSSTKVYPNLGDNKTLNSSQLTHAVYYIKRETQYNGSTYYLLSTSPSATTGTVGWARASELTTHAHTVVDKQSKSFQVKGSGSAYTKAWGGNKDLVYNLANEKGKTFQVHLTEKVGNNTWYRGTLNNRTVWIHSSHVETTGKATSRLGHLYSSTKVYRNLGDSATLNASQLTHAVYYIKREAQYNGSTYYLLSTSPSATNGVVGWARASELTTHAHTVVDKNSKNFIVSGSGSAYTKAWGGNKDLVYNLSNERGKTFQVHLTEKVGNNTWYRGTLNNRTVWIHSSHVTTNQTTRTNYDITLDRAATLQQGANAQTDRYTQYVHKDYVRRSGSNYFVNATSLNVRSGPGTNYAVVDTLRNGQRLSIRRQTGDWYQLFWVDANKSDIIYNMNPNNFINDRVQQFQFLDLAKTSGATASALNNFLRGKGTLAGQGQAFIDAGRTHGINDVYLLSHALLETGHGTSTLARGVQVNGVTVYNMYGIGARDHCPIECGSQYAYDQGWTTPYKSIVGGAAFIGNSYVKAGQNTLYKMRWNPEALVRNGRPTHQYATDIGWASKQVHTMYNLYQGIGSYSLILDIPVYR